MTRFTMKRNREGRKDKKRQRSNPHSTSRKHKARQRKIINKIMTIAKQDGPDKEEAMICYKLIGAHPILPEIWHLINC